MGELIATRDAFGNALIACGGENKDIGQGDHERKV